MALAHSATGPEEGGGTRTGEGVGFVPKASGFSRFAEMTTASSAVAWLQAAAQDAANATSSSRTDSTAAFPDHVLVSRASGYASPFFSLLPRFFLFSLGRFGCGFCLVPLVL